MPPSSFAEDSTRSARRMGRTRKGTNVPLLIIAGQSGTGKTAVREILAAQTASTSLGPDDHPDGWASVLPLLDAAPSRAIVECCRVPGRLMRRTHGRLVCVVELTADIETRRLRLTQRGDHPTAIDKRLTEDGSLGYEDEVRPQITLDTTNASAAEVAASLFQTLRGTPWGV